MFEPWGTSHLVVLVVFALGVVALLFARRAGRRLATTYYWRVRATLATGVVTEFSDGGRVAGNLPLQLCDFAWVPVAWALLRPHPVALALTYYWGLTLSLQAMAQPTLDEAFPDPNFFAFWGKHVLLVWGAVYATLTLRQGPDWRGYRIAVLATAAWVAGAMLSNTALDTNYGYFNGKPDGTVLDLLGPWPWYVLAEVVIVAAVWLLITVPWVRKRT